MRRLAKCLLILSIVLQSCNDFNEDDLVSAPSNPPQVTAISPTSGPKETIVEIKGEFFGMNPQSIVVTFNSATAPVSFVSDTLIVAEVPIGAGSGPVSVIRRGESTMGPVFNYVKTATVSTFAGSGLFGNKDGTGVEAEFSGPSGIDIDTQGNIYVADFNNHRIRKITPTGVVTTIAGTTQGYLDGSKTQAMFNFPYDVTWHSNGNLYVSDALNNRIRQVDPSGMVTTFAGNDQIGLLDGTGSDARFFGPAGIKASSTGNIYVTDLFNNCVRKISLAAYVETYAGTNAAGFVNGIRTVARFNSPSGVTVAGDDLVYVTEWGNHAIRKILPSGVSTVAGTGSSGYIDGSTVAAQFSGPNGLAIDGQGNFYVADRYNNCIRSIGGNQVSTLAGSSYNGFADGEGSEAAFSEPTDVAIGIDGALYVADFGGNRIRKIVIE